ncbi:TPA: DUF551 domain-containing protein [Escherichia coli]|nr:DUF551 domain-containing protein [Escherichia coli]EEY1253329.1 DUF551 domain-containing protein [Escherichia coli]EEZ6574211.1 DUF551 domain-containing protein [Escherichia coli]EFA2512192.1 DUF551 domain-containing protein [Escherichia coli]EFB2081649.1 DUF551 domain-containing protein [Escherichia coli]
MTTITKERIELFIKNPLDNGLTRGEQMELAQIALASLAAEPMAWKWRLTSLFDGVQIGPWRVCLAPLSPGKGDGCKTEAIPLYTAPPVPVVPAALPENDDEDGHDIDYLEPSEVYALGRTSGWNAYRAAMLQAEPVSNSDELPLDYLQGHKDGLEWAAQLAEANHPQTGDWLYDDPIDLARAIRKGPDMPTVQGGNSPVTPDGWISCSERMPEMGERQCYVLAADFKNNYPPNIPNTQVGVYGDWFNDGNPTWDDGDGEDLYLKEVTHWMPLPEPPQEVNRG